MAVELKTLDTTPLVRCVGRPVDATMVGEALIRVFDTPKGPFLDGRMRTPIYHYTHFGVNIRGEPVAGC